MGDTVEILQAPAIVVEIAGPAGIQGPPGTTDYTQLINKPSTDAVTEGSTNLYHTSARASAAAPVQSVAGRTGAVTLAKADVGLANVANTAQVTSVTGTAPIASSGGTTPAISISAATTSAAGSMSAADKTKLDGVATSANNYVHPNHTGDVTSAGDGATTIAADAVTNAKLANVTSQTIKGRAGASTGDPEDLTAAQVRSILNVADGAEVNVNADWTASSGDAQILNKPSTFAPSAHTHAISDVNDLQTALNGKQASGSYATTSHVHSSATTTVAGFLSTADKTKLDGVATSANNYVHPNHTGDVTSAGDGATTIAADAVTNAKLANVTSQTIKGRASASTGDPEDLTAAQVRSILNVADGAEVNVNADWTASSGDAQILNKPVLNGVITNAFHSGYGTGVANINWAAASYWSGSLGLTGGTTIDFQNVIVGKTITFDLTGTGYAVAWPAGITWIGGSVPVIGSSQTVYLEITATSATTFVGAVKTRLASSASYTDLVGVPATFTPTSHTHENATFSVAGFMSVSDRTKLNGIAEGAEVNVNADWNATTGDAQILNKPSTFAPSAHTHVISDVTDLQTALNGKQASGSYAASSHVHGNITNAGAIGATASLPVITTAGGVLTTGTFGTTANTFCQGNDSRLSDSRTPTAHTHAISDVTGAAASVGASDIEITNNTKGVILKSPNNTRYRLTVSNSGLPIFTALLLFLLVSLAPAQNVGMATATNGTILTDRTTALTFTNPVAWIDTAFAAIGTTHGTLLWFGLPAQLSVQGTGGRHAIIANAPAGGGAAVIGTSSSGGAAGKFYQDTSYISPALWVSRQTSSTNSATLGVGSSSTGSTNAKAVSVSHGTNEVFFVRHDGAVSSLYQRFGSGSPNGIVIAPVGAVYHRTDGGAGTSFYVKQSGTGNTGWVAK